MSQEVNDLKLADTTSRGDNVNIDNNPNNIYAVEEVFINGFEIFQGFKRPSCQQQESQHKPYACLNDNKSRFERKRYYNYNYNYNYNNASVSKSNSPIKLSKLSDIKFLEYRPRRAGVIVKTKFNGVIYFGMGVDWRTGDLTDFGGSIEYGKQDNDAFIGAKREFYEESMGLFGEISNDAWQQSLCIASSEAMIIIVEVAGINPTLIKSQFRSKLYNDFLIKEDVMKKQAPELRDMVWLNRDSLLTILKRTGTMINPCARSIKTEIVKESLSKFAKNIDYPYYMWNKIRDLLIKALPSIY